jgi:LPXTG-site transpeptidase (sortase) family protein
MNFQYTRACIAVVILFSAVILIFSQPLPVTASLPNLGGDKVYNTQSNSNAFRLDIPSISLDLAVVTAPFTGQTWDFSNIERMAGYFEGTPLPGVGGNVVIGAHSELANRVPGPFYRLSRVREGADIFVMYGGQRFRYRVTATWTVDPSDVSPVYDANGDALTLLTCSGYNDGVYRTRFIVRAMRID